jgi:transcription factor TFIIIB component B''
MSSFSSVVRKPGPKVAPKAAPRRNVQRRAQKTHPDLATANALTPEPLPQSPASKPATPPPSAPDAVAAEAPSTIPTLTPPPTATESVTTYVPLIQPSVAIEQSQFLEGSRSQAPESAVPTAAVPLISPTRLRGPVPAAQENAAAYTVAVAKQSLAQATEDHTQPPRKRRKFAEKAPEAELNSVIDPRLRTPVSSSNASHAVAARALNSVTSETDALLQQVSSNARTISDLANSIDNRSRQSRSRTRRLASAEEDGEYRTSRSRSSSAQATDSRTVAIKQAAAAVIARAVNGKKAKGTRHRRGYTPEDAESHKIDENATSMSDLLKDSGLGQRSETGKRLESEWVDIKSRWDQKLEQNRSKAKMKPSQRKAARETATGEGEELVDDPLATVALGVPQITLVNGQIAVVEESRQVDFSHNLTERVAAVDDALVQTDERIYNYINQNRIGKKAGLQSKTRWNRELTDKFYHGLRMFGTDFELIASFFGGDWTRRQIKAKYCREEKDYLDRILEALAQREQVDLSGYGALVPGAIQGLRDPKEIQAEIEAEERRIRDEYEKAKHGEQPLEDEADQPVESIETDLITDARSQAARETPTENRFSALAEKVMRRPTQTAQKRQPLRKQREQTGASKTGAVGGRKSNRAKKPLEGVEERIGNVGDVDL